ncbi:hypothetical protein LCGC14_0791660 [marine sediment metagenome]|uniref:Uncharacterized protein n=1 Tax=marine sediment metagenome TaxID=412755 RepID=A0A0F9PSG8_9ZZZZ
MELGLESPLVSLLAAGASVPLGTRGLVHVWGRNGMATTQRLGIGWTVTDPNGQIAEEYGTWEAWPYTGAGDEHEFIGDRFDIDKAGDWMIVIELRMNIDSPVVVDSYVGLLCRVEGYAGTITRKELEYDSVRGAIPVS